MSIDKRFLIAFLQKLLYYEQITLEMSGKDIVGVYDGWSDRFSKRSYIGLVARYMANGASGISQRILGVRLLPHPHTHGHIRDCVLAVLRDYKVDEHQVNLFYFPTILNT